jgi:hypothetical protein
LAGVVAGFQANLRLELLRPSLVRGTGVQAQWHEEKREELAMDREQVSRLLGQKVAVRLTNVEARGVEITATLDEVREDGVVLSEVGELGPGPRMFCPWDSLLRVRDRPPWLAPPHEEREPVGETQEPASFDIERASAREPESPVERRREPSARALERVVPVARKQTVGDVTVALTAMELFGEGVGALRWRVSLGEVAYRREPDFGFGIPEPVFEILDDAGRKLPWGPRDVGASDRESDGEIEVRNVPESGELRVEVVRLVADAYGPEGEYLGEGASLDGPWRFRFSI